MSIGMRPGRAVSFLTVAAAACALAFAAAAGCSSGSSGPAASGDGGGGGGSKHDTTTDSPGQADSPGQTDSPAQTDSPVVTDAPPATDSPPGDAVAPTDGAADSSAPVDAGLPDGYVGYIEDIPVSAQVTAMAVNQTTDLVYIATISNAGQSGGITVLDDSTLAVTTTIPPVTNDAGAVPPYFSSGNVPMVVDETANVLYAVRQFSHVVDVFNLATNAYATTLDVSTIDTACTGTVQWLAVDGARSRLYASCGTSSVEIAVIGTGGGSYTLVAGIPLTDLQASGGAALALDTTNQLLFVSNYLPGPGKYNQQTILVDQIDTTTNAEVTAAQQNLGTGASIGTVGAAGTAVLVDVTNVEAGADASGGTFFSLEPQSFNMQGLPESVVVCPAYGSIYLVIVSTGTELIYSQVKVDPTDKNKPFIGNQASVDLPQPTGTLDPVELLCAKYHCYWNGYQYVASGSNPYKWILSLINGCK